MLPSFMAKLFWKRMGEVAEGVGVGGGAEHERGGEGTARVLLEYEYEEEEEIEEDTSRQAQHGVSGPGGNENEHEGSSSGSSSSNELVEHDGEGAGEHPGGTERMEEHEVALGERVDARVKHMEQDSTFDNGAVEEQEGGAAAQEGGAGVQQQEGGAAQQEGVAAAHEGGAGGQEQEGGEATQKCHRGDERHVTVRRRHRTASGSGQVGPSTAGHSTSTIASGGQVVELMQRVVEVKAPQKKLVADVFAKHSEQAAVFNKLAREIRTAWSMISESSKSTLKQCDDAVNDVMEERKLLEGARMKLDEMSEKIIEGVAAAITKASEDIVEKQLKLVEERLVASVVKGIDKAIKEDLFYSTLPPESMKELKDVPGSIPTVACPSSRAKSVEDNEVMVLDQSPLQKASEAAPKPPPDAFSPLRDMLQGLGKKGGKGVVAGEKSGAPIESVASAGGAVEKRGASTPSGGAAGKERGRNEVLPARSSSLLGCCRRQRPTQLRSLVLLAVLSSMWERGRHPC
ncbi:unnamed protein product [Closterium sp. Naga37s-1]|nr:unnamed protein product [Closterium sp. Naga37s-1]